MNMSYILERVETTPSHPQTKCTLNKIRGMQVNSVGLLQKLQPLLSIE